MILSYNYSRKRGRLFGQYGGAGNLTVYPRVRGRIHRQGKKLPLRSPLNSRAPAHTRAPMPASHHNSRAPTHTRAHTPASHLKSHGAAHTRTPASQSKAPKRKGLVTTRRRRRPVKRRAPKKKANMTENLFEAGKQALKKNVKKIVKKNLTPANAARLGAAAGEMIAPSVAKLGSRSVSAVRKRFSPDSETLNAATFPPTSQSPEVIRQKITRQRRKAHRGVVQHLKGMRIKRGGGYFF